MNRAYDVLIQEVLSLAAKNAPKEEILAKAIEAKKAIWEAGNEMQKAVNILDGLVPYLVPDAAWEYGWVVPKSKPITTPSAGTAPARKLRTLEIVSKLVDEGVSTVSTEEIAKRLRSEGDMTPPRALATAIGNILARTGMWERVARGQYINLQAAMKEAQ